MIRDKHSLQTELLDNHYFCLCQAIYSPSSSKKMNTMFHNLSLFDIKHRIVYPAIFNHFLP